MRIILDCNIFVSALISPQGTCGSLLRYLLLSQEAEIVLTNLIQEEIEETIIRPKIQKLSRRSKEELSSWFSMICIGATRVSDKSHAKGVCRDPDDDIYLSAAVESGARIIVSGDKDLLSIKEYEGISVLKPSEFFSMLRQI